MNSVIQGSAADLAKAAMLRVDSAIRRELPPRVRCSLVLHLHDELIYVVSPKSVAGKFCSLLRRELSSAGDQFAMTVPLPVKVKTGTRWSDLELIE